VLGGEGSELPGNGAFLADRASSSRRLGNAKDEMPCGLRCALTAANVAKLQTDLDASPEHDGGPKKRARVMAWKEGADRAGAEPCVQGRGHEVQAAEGDRLS
jgi:hypothetical protein